MRRYSHFIPVACWLVFTSFAATFRADAQLIKQSINYEGGTRSWFEYVPAAYDGSKNVPLVIALHGAYNSGDNFAQDSGWMDVAHAHNFIAIFPDGEGTNNSFVWHSWTFDGSKPDDIGFLLKVIQKVETRYHIDTTRVYMTGFSNGGGMTSFFASYHANLLTAIAPMSAGWVTNTGNSDSILHPNALLPVWVWRGADDPTGDTPTVFVQDQQQTAFWVKFDKESTAPVRTVDGNETTDSYLGGSTRVRYTSVAGLQHAVAPDSAARVWRELFAPYSRINGVLHYAGVSTVKVSVAEPKARPASGTKGIFVLSRDDTTDDVTVNYEVTGTAVGGIDYVTLPGTATLPAGTSSRKVKVRPLPADEAAGKKTVRLSLLPSDGYLLDDPAAGKVKIVEGD